MSTGSGLGTQSHVSGGGLFGAQPPTFSSVTTGQNVIGGGGGLFAGRRPPATCTRWGSGRGLSASSTATGGGLFASPTATGGGLFASSTATGGEVFVSSTATGGGLFASRSTAIGGGLFQCASSTATGGELFASSTATGGGLFASSIGAEIATAPANQTQSQGCTDNFNSRSVSLGGLVHVPTIMSQGSSNCIDEV